MPSNYEAEVKNCSPSLKNYAYYLTQDHEDANDLFQETLLKAFVHFGKYKPDTNLKAWLYTIMKNTFINAYRRKMKQNTFLDKTDNQYFIDSSEVTQVYQNLGESRLVLEDINAAIDTLPVELKDAFKMNYTGFKYQEIAEAFKIPIGTVKTRIHLARQILKRKLHVYGSMYGMGLAS